MKLLIASLLLLIIMVLLLLAKMLLYRKASLQDELTGLPNFRALKLLLKRKLKSKPIGIAILDIDNFKNFNRISIHKGDDVLKEFSAKISELISSDIRFFRYRLGDEFALVFLNCSSETMQEEMQKIKSFFQNYCFDCLPEMPDYRISFCYGVSQLAADCPDVDSLFEIAEQQLAIAKMKKYTEGK